MNAVVADELNPYASPSEPGGYDSRSQAGVGAWRDGDLLVIHPAATLPRYCVKTGEPADGTIEVVIHRSFVIDSLSRRLALDVPISHTGHRQLWKQRRSGCLTTIVGVGVLVGSASILSNDVVANGIRYIALLITCVAAAGMVLRWQPLQYVRARSPYFWLRGADKRFLARLPPWTSGS